jgi:integrase
MPEKRVTVWVTSFPDRKNLMLQWKDPGTNKVKSKSAQTADPKEAESRRVDLESDLNNGRYAEASRMSWERFRELFEEEFLPGRRPSTRDNYRDTLNVFERLCNPRNLRGITERTISSFVATLWKQPGIGGNTLAPSTIKVRLQYLHTALQWAEDQKLLPSVPKFPTVKVPRRRPQPVPAEAFEKMLDKAPDANMRAFLLCGWLAGLRLNEARLLEWEANDEAPYLDPARDRIILPAGFVKAVEDQWLPLDPDLWRVLDALPRRGKRVFRFEAQDGHEVGAGRVSHRVVDIARLAGVKLTMRSLRRGFGCRCAGKVPAQVLQKLMRHSNIRVTMDYYANIDDAAMEAVLGRRHNSPHNSCPTGHQALIPADSGNGSHRST